MTHVVSKELFQRIQQRWEKANHPAIVDYPLLDVMIELNKIPGIATTWSCAGHTFEEKKRPLPEGFDRDRYMIRSYIAIVVSEEHPEMLQKFLNWSGSGVTLTYRPVFKTVLVFTHLRLGGLTRLKEDYDVWYPVISVEISYNPYKDLKRNTYREIAKSMFPFLKAEEVKRNPYYLDNIKEG